MTDKLRKEAVAGRLKLGEGEYELPPLTLNMLEKLENEFDCSTTELAGLLEKKMAGTLKKLLNVMLRDNYPDMTPEHIGELVDIRNLEAVSTAVARILTSEK